MRVDVWPFFHDRQGVFKHTYTLRSIRKCDCLFNFRMYIWAWRLRFPWQPEGFETYIHGQEPTQGCFFQAFQEKLGVYVWAFRFHFPGQAEGFQTYIKVFSMLDEHGIAAVHSTAFGLFYCITCLCTGCNSTPCETQHEPEFNAAWKSANPRGVLDWKSIMRW